MIKSILFKMFLFKVTTIEYIIIIKQYFKLLSSLTLTTMQVIIFSYKLFKQQINHELKFKQQNK